MEIGVCVRGQKLGINVVFGMEVLYLFFVFKVDIWFWLVLMLRTHEHAMGTHRNNILSVRW